MHGQSTDREWISAQIPANYRGALLDRAILEDRSMSSVVRSALAAFLFDDRPAVELDERQK